MPKMHLPETLSQKVSFHEFFFIFLPLFRLSKKKQFFELFIGNSNIFLSSNRRRKVSYMLMHTWTWKHWRLFGFERVDARILWGENGLSNQFNHQQHRAIRLPLIHILNFNIFYDSPDHSTFDSSRDGCRYRRKHSNRLSASFFFLLSSSHFTCSSVRCSFCLCV